MALIHITFEVYSALAITADFGSMEFFFASKKKCLSKNKSGNLICRGVFLLTDPQLAPPSK
jgi:hypothetical protein